MIHDELDFAQWVPHVIKKKTRVISKVKSKYWTRTCKFGIRILKSAKEAKKIYYENGNILQQEAICEEMKNVRVAFKLCDGDSDDLPSRYQYVDCHMIFDIKMGENFR